MDDLKSLIQKGWNTDLTDEELLKYFKDLYLKYPENPRISYEYGGAHDYLGLKNKAIFFYLEALELGIAGEYRVKTLIQVGSTYRNLGKYSESMDALKMAVEESNGDPAAVIFLSLTLLSSGKVKEAVFVSLRHIYTEERGLVKRYRRSIGNYLNEMESEAPQNS